MPRFRMRNIKALFILNIEEMNFFKIKSKCITFVGIDHMWYICYYYCIAGYSLGALLYLKTKTPNILHLRSFHQLLRKVQVSGCFFMFHIPKASCNIEVTTFVRFHNLAQILL